MAILADKFFESYDLLPAGYKALIYDSASTPTMEDLATVWKLVEAEGSFDKLFREHARKYDPEEWKLIRDREREEHERQKRLKPSKWDLKLAARGRWITTIRQAEIDPKQARLVERVKADVALDMVTKKQAKVVSKTIVTREWVPYKSRAEREREQNEAFKAKYGYDPTTAPDKYSKAGTNKRMGNSF
jgi:hypothetical protein